MRRTRSPKPGSPKWVEERRKALFATDAAACSGLSRFSDPFMVYMEKLGLTAPKLETNAMRWGMLLEPVVAKEWAHEKGVRITSENQWTYWRDDVGFPMGSHTDYRTPDGILEVKTASHFSAKDFGEQDTDEIPLDYRLQAVHEMAVLDVPRCHFAVLVGGNDPRRYVIERDLELEGQLLTIEAAMWQSIETRTPPEIDASDGASAYIKTLMAHDDGTEIELDEATAELGLSLLATKQTKKQAEALELELSNKIKARLGPASVARAGDMEITWRQSKPTTVIGWEQIAKAYRHAIIDEREGLDVYDLSDDALDAIESLYTSEKEGARPLLVKLKES